MGTRNVIAVYSNGDYKVAQYGQWDGNPSGQGLDVLRILKSMNLQRLKEQVNKCSWIAEEKYQNLWKDFGVSPDDKFVSCEIGDRFNKRYPQFDRATESDILNIIAQSDEGIELTNNIDFANDSLMCEWAYVIDLDKNRFEVYEGFNEQPLTQEDRFYTEADPYEACDKSKYYPIKIKASFNLDDLPEKEKFLEICEPKDDEE